MALALEIVGLLVRQFTSCCGHKIEHLADSSAPSGQQVSAVTYLQPRNPLGKVGFRSSGNQGRC